MKITELAFCCYAITDMTRAREFYEGILNLEPTTVTNTEHGQWIEYEFGPYALALGCAPGFKPSPDGCAAALEVEDFDAAVAHLKRHNVKWRIEPLATPICRMTMIFDPDGNTVCIQTESRPLRNRTRSHEAALYRRVRVWRDSLRMHG
jgi:predicted enzyme related to lactoylglutathione lyase